MESLLCLLEAFERVGLKKVPERLQVLKELKDKIDEGQLPLEELLQVVYAYPDTLKNKVSQQMATLAMQKIAVIAEETKLLKKELSVELVFYLLRPTTTEEMRAPLSHNFLVPFLAKTDHQTQTMHRMIHYCNDNFDAVDLNSHLKCI